MLECDVVFALSVVGLHTVDESVGALKVEPALLLATEFDGTLVEDGIDVDSTFEAVVLTADGTGGTQLVDGSERSGGIVLSQLSLSLDEIHLSQTEDDEVTCTDVVGWEVGIVLVVEELLDARVDVSSTSLGSVVTVVAIDS